MTPEPIHRGRLRLWLGARWYRARRWAWWRLSGTAFAKKREEPPCPFLFQGEYWGGYTRHNTVFRRAFDLDGVQVADELVCENHAVMMYDPMLPEGKGET